jgi:hypothetical protein
MVAIFSLNIKPNVSVKAARSIVVGLKPMVRPYVRKGSVFCSTSPSSEPKILPTTNKKIRIPVPLVTLGN